MSDDDLRELGRRLGFDFATYGVELWGSAAALAGVSEGYASRKAERPLRLNHDRRHTRKWLQLRVSALDRKKVVDDAIDADFIAAIDCETCPVTLESLTHGMSRDSDWSIDRLNNNGGYAVGNLVVMSRRANSAKSAKSLIEVVEIAERGEIVGGLTPAEWLRLASLMVAPCVVNDSRLFVAYADLPLATRIPTLSVRLQHQQFQRLLLEAALDFQTYRQVSRQLQARLKSRERWTEVELMIERVKRRLPTCEYPYDALIDEDLQVKRMEFYLHLTPGERTGLKAYLLESLGGEVPTTHLTSRWALGTTGLLA